ncbi:hypothetical protein H9Y04_19750 [Streptomyces sp. TRM66268-LWL]|uniref:SHSP domain-containing protein n=1 Tax=Streptomyces polyasparticus TaxID=2767826 RepID=A0ABR7SJB4_9ACTN|nr:hypothetical protein [Streptomyces polyasparticus]MBC9714790.1 hypothetical protein [Streptomyces polyasparticus]
MCPTDPLPELDRLAQQDFATLARPALMPIDTYREMNREHIQASYEAGMLTVRRPPKAEQAEPRRIEISRGRDGAREITR